MPPRAAPQPSSPPIGFLLLGMALTVLALITGIPMMEESAGPFGRAVLAAVAVLSACLIEALWWTRPWVGRTVDAWAAACILGTVASSSRLIGDPGYGMALAFVGCFVVLPCTGVRWYVRGRARRLGLLP